MSDETDRGDSLTGVWNGSFSHPEHEPISFLATLIESGDWIHGSTHEPCTVLDCPRQTHAALLSGRRNGSIVHFSKKYDPPGFGYDEVEYDGTINADATEIAGTWAISVWGLVGKFVMMRAGTKAQARTEPALERT